MPTSHTLTLLSKYISPPSIWRHPTSTPPRGAPRGRHAPTSCVGHPLRRCRGVTSGSVTRKAEQLPAGGPLQLRCLFAWSADRGGGRVNASTAQAQEEAEAVGEAGVEEAGREEEEAGKDVGTGEPSWKPKFGAVVGKARYIGNGEEVRQVNCDSASIYRKRSVNDWKTKWLMAGN